MRSNEFSGANCPDCGSWLHLTESNYSGCGVDMVECANKKCGHAFQVSYRIDRIDRCPDWEA